MCASLQVCIVLGLSPSWVTMQSLLEDPGFRARLIALTPDSVQVTFFVMLHTCVDVTSLCSCMTMLWYACVHSRTGRLGWRSSQQACCSV